MKKVFSTAIAVVLLVLAWGTFALDIVTRQEWGANPEYLYTDSPSWKAILDGSEGYVPPAKTTKIHRYLTTTFPDYFDLTDPIGTWEGRPLATSLRYVKDVKRIVLHHTARSIAEDTRSEEEIVRGIYKFHALNRMWGDIGYNFIIGPSGKIYEGRMGGGNARAFHTRWNNEHSIGIALLGNFEEEKPSHLQILGLVRLVDYLIEEYDIDLSDHVLAYRECADGEDCENHIDVDHHSWFIGHKHAGNTGCPGKHLESWIEPLRGYFEQSHALARGFR